VVLINNISFTSQIFLKLHVFLLLLYNGLPYYYTFFIQGMRKEYAHARSLAIAQAQVLRAYDEIKMATSRLRLRENVDDNSIDAVSLEELDIRSVENSSEKFVSLATLSRIRGKLRYLQVQVRSQTKFLVPSFTLLPYLLFLLIHSHSLCMIISIKCGAGIIVPIRVTEFVQLLEKAPFLSA